MTDYSILETKPANSDKYMRVYVNHLSINNSSYNTKNYPKMIYIPSIIKADGFDEAATTISYELTQCILDSTKSPNETASWFDDPERLSLGLSKYITMTSLVRFDCDIDKLKDSVYECSLWHQKQENSSVGFTYDKSKGGGMTEIKFQITYPERFDLDKELENRLALQ